jgi:hypothetical protein
MAKMQGLDPNEMANILSVDYRNQARDRENQKSQRLGEIQTNRDQRMGILEAEKQGTLDILKQDFEKSAGIRNAAYDAKLAAQEQELAAARAAYDAAIQRAKTPPPVPEGNESESLGDQLKQKTEELMRGFHANFGNKVSVTGSFSAAEAATMGFGSTMDRVAKATEQSEKHLAKLAAKDTTTSGKVVTKKETSIKDSASGEDPTVRELKLQTRYLRDLSEKGMGATFG